MRITAIVWMIPLLLFPSCQKEEKGMKALDLSPYGLPLSILAPDSALVTVKVYPFMRDINIRKDDHFHIELFELQSNKNDPATEKKRQMNAIKKDPTFVEILKEYDQGFIYSKKRDSTTIDYDFRYFRYLGEKQLIFQSGVLTAFGLKDIEQMVEAIKVRPGQ